MMKMRSFLKRFAIDDSGTTLIETAFIVPILATVALGGVEVSNIVKRQAELQNAISKSAEIIMAAAPENDDEVSAMLNGVAAKMQAETGLTTTVLGYNQDPNTTLTKVAYVMRRYRCGNSNTFKKADNGCTDSTHARKFVVFYIRDQYSPVWNQFSIGNTMDYHVKKSIQIG